VSKESELYKIERNSNKSIDCKEKGFERMQHKVRFVGIQTKMNMII